MEGRRLQPNNLDTTSFLQWQTMGEPEDPIRDAPPYNLAQDTTGLPTATPGGFQY
jgi:hypothetical protein